MSIASPCGFIAAYVNHSQCELYLERDVIIAYIPSKATWEATITLGTTSFTTACQIAREMGLEPTWN